MVRGPKEGYLLSARGEVNGQRVLRWAMPDRSVIETVEYRTYDRKIELSEPEPLIFKLWQMLDEKVAFFMGPTDAIQDAEKVAKLKSEARGMAEAIAVLMQPFVKSADEVVKHAVKRYKAKQAGEDYQVPGLGEHLWNPLYDEDGNLRQQPTAKIEHPRAQPKASNKKLKPEEIAGIKDAVSSGMFSEEDVASMFKVSVQTIKEALA